MASPFIAWGSMAASCDRNVRAFLAACIGCSATQGVLLLDERPTACPTSAALHVAWAPPRVPAWTASVSALNATHEVGRPIADFRTRFFKLVALFRVLTSHDATARATWYLKADLDTFVNLRALGALLAHWQANSTAGYVGKPIRSFLYRGRPLTFMQGGAFALRRAGAAALAGC